jgi:CBS domain containing-hemolysin-like protein
MNVFSVIMNPIAQACVWITHKIPLGPLKRRQESPFLTSPELKFILTQTNIPETSRKILGNVLDFGQTKVKDVMVPRSQIFAASIKEPMPKIIERVIKSGLSRIPIYTGSLDNLVGLLYAKDLLAAWRSDTLILIEDVLRPLYKVEMEMPLSDVMRAFKTGRHHMAIVVGGQDNKRVMGLITIEDSLEAIVGNIKEET